MDQTLREDPAGIYSEMDFETRDQYRQVVEEIAKASGRSETDVAREVIKLTLENTNPSSRMAVSARSFMSDINSLGI